MLLNIEGGPNHLNGSCNAAFIWDASNQTLLIQPTFYYMGQISKFVLPNSVRIDTQVSSESIQAVSVVTPENNVVTVVMNRGDKPISIELLFKEKVADYVMQAHTITTFSFGIF